ncbi:MAG: bifunctional (p)ppGpp synthetase/guanosine-3',5'-bis(diphosphate) 3'-pyrophosphohydrolase [Magnetococcales bacterium]|nr:bifunctional (p)ppGpp synthetase/guanosine-3',5'-bis(diphosphate) 3'-pyrophosphohydrolase [Magnetococcales bacterium]MBF0113909.1 bifunctional (p)ppGpp synthetase/guanosine-3',5'-bis(diphosphate) 3'-pyrophosphohydrolase [Magnetococcales bacterium]
MADLERALYLAVVAHQGQVDKVGVPYILHPLRLMVRAGSDEAKIVAILHDTIEDTALTLAQLRDEGFSETVLTVLDLLTHQPDHTYQEYMERVMTHPLAMQIKLLDLEDNMDVRRLQPELSESDQQRLAKYAHYWKLLRATLFLSGSMS